MPPLLDPGAGDPIGPDELMDVLATTRADPRDEAGFAELGPWLARLGRNRRFLSDLAVAELESRCAGQRGNGYGAQVLMLGGNGGRTGDGRFAVRANFWPAARDPAVLASGEEAFFYGVPHDHHFPFLTWGYLGPGYWSDYWEADADGRDRRTGDPAGLAYTGRARLEPGRLMLYRAHRDVHAQRPPDAFSVSLNILGHDPAQLWRGQYRFDPDADRVAEPLTAAPSEALAMLAVHLGGEGGRALVAELARRHPAARMRRTALAALAAEEQDTDRRAALFAAAADDPDPDLRAAARACLDGSLPAGRDASASEQDVRRAGGARG